MTAITDSSPVDAVSAALADPILRRPVELLALPPYCAEELASALGVTRPAMSRHLRAPRQGSLVIDTSPASDTRVRIYQLRQELFDDVRRWLERTERGWNERLETFSVFVGEYHDP